MLQSVVTFVDRGNHQGDHFPLGARQIATTAHQRLVQLEMGEKTRGIQPVDPEDVVHAATGAAGSVVQIAQLQRRIRFGYVSDMGHDFLHFQLFESRPVQRFELDHFFERLAERPRAQVADLLADDHNHYGNVMLVQLDQFAHAVGVESDHRPGG